MTTERRQLKTLIEGILQGHGIINNLLADNLTDAAISFQVRVKQGITPEKARGDILAFYMLGMEETIKRSKIIDRIETALKLNPTAWDRTIIDFIQKKDEQGETIEEWAAWCESDKYNSPKTHQIAMHPDIIKTMWPAAFAGKTKEIVPEVHVAQPKEVQFVPSPRRQNG